jgi:ABC-type glycerol-3-phosphate transport system substrate-binding protein
MDKKQLEIAQRFTKDTGIKIRIDGISHMGPQQQKLAAEVQTQAGHDLIELRMHFPWLYEPQLVDVSEVVTELEKKHGKALASGVEAAQVQGVWRAVPMYHGMFVPTYREDLFKKAGLKVPDTWEDLYLVGKELKKMGNPVGIPIAQNYDSISTAGPVLWSFGGLEVDKDGQTVRINGPATEQMIEWYKKMFRDCMEPEVLSWSDASNNESLQQGKAGWIHNPVSAYIVAKQRKLPTADLINHHRSLGGPHPPRDRRATLDRHLEILQEYRAGQGVDPLPHRQAGRLRRVDHVGRRVQPLELREAPGPPRPPHRSEVRVARRTRRPVPPLRVAGARDRQGPAHNERVSPAQHDREGGDGHAGQRGHGLGREGDEADHQRVTGGGP